VFKWGAGQTPCGTRNFVKWLTGRFCFAAGTPLLTPEGGKPIERFAPGDWVLARPEGDPGGAVEARRVEEVFVRTAPIMELRVGGRLIRTTAEHPFWVQGRGWVAARELRAGDVLVGHDGHEVVAEGVEETGRWATVYNLRVAEFHTYFVGAKEWGFSVWSHNANDCFGAGITPNSPRALTLSAGKMLSLEMVEGRGAWKRLGRGLGLKIYDSIVYVVRDMAGEYLKVGETGKWETRFGVYLQRAIAEGREIVIDIFRLPSKARIDRTPVESDIRRTLSGMGHKLPWDDSRYGWFIPGE
jgi:hypothetical protein